MVTSDIYVCLFDLVNYSTILFYRLLFLQATGIRLGTMIQSLSSIGTGIIIAFIYSWEFALFILGIAPLFLIAGLLQMKIYLGFAGTEALEGAGQVSVPLYNYYVTVYLPVTRNEPVLAASCERLSLALYYSECLHPSLCQR